MAFPAMLSNNLWAQFSLKVGIITQNLHVVDRSPIWPWLRRLQVSSIWSVHDLVQWFPSSSHADAFARSNEL